MPTSVTKHARKRPPRKRRPASSRRSAGGRKWLRPSAIALTAIIVFACLLIMDTGAILQLIWMSLLGKLGLGARLLAAAATVVLLLPLFIAVWNRATGPSVSKRRAPARKVQRRRPATSKLRADNEVADQGA